MRNYISQPCISCALGLLPLVGTTAANQAGRKAVQHMVAGKKRRVWIPEELAYKGAPGAPQGMLVFDIERLEIKKSSSPPVLSSSQNVERIFMIR